MRGFSPREHFDWSFVPRFGGSAPAGNTTTTQTNEPWSGEQPSLQRVYSEANNLYDNSIPQYYPGSTYVPMSGLQNSIATGLAAYGLMGGNTGLNAANGFVTNTLAPGYTSGTQTGLDAAQNNLMSTVSPGATSGSGSAFNAGNNTLSSFFSPNFTGTSSGVFNTGENTLGNMASGNYSNVASGALGSGSNALGSIANGNFTSNASPAFGAANNVLGNELSTDYLNPWSSPSFGTVVNNTLASVIPATSASFVNGGRADSGLAQRAQTMAATDAVGNLAQQQYQANQAIQNQAVSQASQNNQNAATNAISAATGAGNLYGTIGGLQQSAANAGAGNYLTQTGQQIQGAGVAGNNFLGQQGNQNTAAGILSNNLLTQQGRQVQTAGVAPLIDQTQSGDLQNSFQAAGTNQTDLQNQLNAQIAAYNYGQMLPWNQLGLFENAVTGTGSPGGTTSTSQPYFTNPSANVLGGVSAAATTAAAIAAIM